MAPSAPQLPVKFPCWCRAVYSWGGETTRDLGFVEGDLIECLNAGDGQWWMGRLRRDRRAVGLFPSNFVELMSEDFVPISRDTSPMVLAGSSPINNPTSAPKKTKTVFRKPFQAHKEGLSPSSQMARSGSHTPVKSSIPQTPPRAGSIPKKVKPLRTHASAVKNQGSVSRPSSVSSRPSSRGISVSPRTSMEPERPSTMAPRGSVSSSRPSSREVSPMPREVSPMQPPTMHRAVSPMPHRAVSPMPQRAVSPMPQRAVSPMYYPASPMHHHYHDHREVSPMAREVSPLQFQEREESPPPPPPPPHRVALNRAPSHSPQPPQHDQYHQRSRSPLLPQPSRSPQPPMHHQQHQSRSPQPHAHAPRASRSPAPLNMNDRYVIFARTPSPGAASTRSAHSAVSAQSDMNGNTPSPLRDAMEDVMTSLEDMGLPREPPSPSPQQAPSPSPLPPSFNNPWSADEYNEINDRTPPATRRRPLTSLGFDGQREQMRGNSVQRNSVYSHDHYIDGPPQLNNYVQRMESRLRQLEDQNRPPEDEAGGPDDDQPPPPPPKHASYHPRHNSIAGQYAQVRSGQDHRGDILNRSHTNKSSATTSSGVQSIGTSMTSSTDKTNQSLMSGISAGGFSATSAGSYARRNGAYQRPNTAMDTVRSRGFSDAGNLDRPETPLTGISYHSSHNTSRQGASSAIPWSSTDNDAGDSGGVFGGLSTPKTKKQGFFKKIFESAKTGAASARSSISVGHGAGSQSPTKGNRMIDVVSPLLTPNSSRDTARDMGLSASSIDWVQVRRDVNRASSPSRNERIERAERCQMMDCPVIYAIEELYDTAEGDESIDGLPISEPTNFNAGNLTLVDKSARFINSIPPLTNPVSLAQGYICRPYKSDVQRLRAIFTWVSEKIAWEEPVDGLDVDMKRVLQAKRGSPQEIAYLVHEMCAAVGLHAETIRGFLKNPGDSLDLDSLSRPNHWWNAVLVDGEWRIMDCALANPTNPQRSRFVTNNMSVAETWYFLTRPLDICFTHVPLYPEEQHICPPVSPDVLLALPGVCPQFFKLGAQFPDYDTSLMRVEGLECVQIRLVVPPDVECAAEVEAPAFACDADGDYFESGDIVRKRALVQPDWFNGQKRITVKAVLPGDEGQGVLKIYAGKKGLMHSSRDIPHPMALALPMVHTGENPPYDFVLRHPTPHAQRHDLYIMQPQCARLAVNNTFVFAVRQHPSSPQAPAKDDYAGTGRASPSVFNRPSSALSMVSSTAGASTISSNSNEFSASTSAISSTRSASGREKPAKLAIQAPSGKILRLTRKADHMISSPDPNGCSVTDAPAEGSVWETVIKIGERGTWRGLVLADRVARWCVFCEWECV
ncbi:putative SH3 domain protein (Cyk3) [Penicillium brasilianum]|uniref:Putative SH3 domain protein (Cyk3) n=1 Tax=Penicillium brasilianum TaxID=104259 RepID=A0A1S9RJ91_PENBI|nr:putative SH3 domain protein (Cyk3) [Penicillium brasilianum]